mmetsp:Transcript_7384/g.32838  ORF Transcript_7384/g.32838 Transcript_7384/m.32838 type:complete len:218 (+) Transcript_7384:2029-2682(+)
MFFRFIWDSRQFRYYLGVTFTTSILLGLLGVLLASEDIIVYVAKYSGQLHLQATSGRMAYMTLIPAFAMQQMYYMLPASAPCVRDILCCHWKRKKADVTLSLFKYRMFERRGDPTFKATSFVMETCVTMFNLSWIPYSYGKDVKKQATPAVSAAVPLFGVGCSVLSRPLLCPSRTAPSYYSSCVAFLDEIHQSSKVSIRSWTLKEVLPFALFRSAMV